MADLFGPPGGGNWLDNLQQWWNYSKRQSPLDWQSPFHWRGPNEGTVYSPNVRVTYADYSNPATPVAPVAPVAGVTEPVAGPGVPRTYAGQSWLAGMVPGLQQDVGYQSVSPYGVPWGRWGGIENYQATGVPPTWSVNRAVAPVTPTWWMPGQAERFEQTLMGGGQQQAAAQSGGVATSGQAGTARAKGPQYKPMPEGMELPEFVPEGWWNAFQEKHEGQTPLEYYGAQGEGLGAALDDLQWSQQVFYDTGSPPSDSDWVQHWYHKRGMYTPEEYEKWKKKLERERRLAREENAPDRPANYIPTQTWWNL